MCKGSAKSFYDKWTEHVAGQLLCRCEKCLQLAAPHGAASAEGMISAGEASKSLAQLPNSFDKTGRFFSIMAYLRDRLLFS